MKNPDGTHYAAPEPALMAMFVFRLRKHPNWGLKQKNALSIQRRIRESSIDAYKFVDLLSLKMSQDTERQIENAFKADSEAFIQQQFLIFNNWPVESKDAFARAVLSFEKQDPKLLEKPSLIIQVTR